MPGWNHHIAGITLATIMSAHGGVFTVCEQGSEEIHIHRVDRGSNSILTIRRIDLCMRGTVMPVVPLADDGGMHDNRPDHGVVEK